MATEQPGRPNAAKIQIHNSDGEVRVMHPLELDGPDLEVLGSPLSASGRPRMNSGGLELHTPEANEEWYVLRWLCDLSSERESGHLIFSKVAWLTWRARDNSDQGGFEDLTKEIGYENIVREQMAYV